MVRKFQQGGQAALQQLQQQMLVNFVQELSLTLNIDPREIIQKAESDPMPFENAFKVWALTQDISQAAQIYVNAIQKAKHGTKLNYIKKLSHKCADDEELVYFKKGGIVDCGCLKKQDGGEVENNPPKNNNTNFIKRGKKIKVSCGTKLKKK